MAVAIEKVGALDSAPLLGVRVDRVTMEQTLQRIEQFVQEGGPHHVVTLDASMCVTAREDPDLRRIILGAALVTPDSAGVLWACRRIGRPMPERVSGVEIVERLCCTDLKLFFFGAGPGVADEAAERLRAKHPGCRIVGTRNGFFRPDEEEAIAAQIRATEADVALVALGIPKQEKWIANHGAATGAAALIGVGGSFDVFSGRVKRAPRWMQRLSLEWLYRLAKNPRKIGKVLTLPRFVLMALRNG